MSVEPQRSDQGRLKNRLYRTKFDVDGASSARVLPWSGKRAPMLDPAEVIGAAIRSAFVIYPKEDDPDWRSPSWIKPEECSHLTAVIMRELEANGFKIVQKVA